MAGGTLARPFDATAAAAIHHIFTRLLASQRQALLHGYANGDSAKAISDDINALANKHVVEQIRRALYPAFAKSAADAINRIVLRQVRKETAAERRRRLAAERAQRDTPRAAHPTREPDEPAREIVTRPTFDTLRSTTAPVDPESMTLRAHTKATDYVADRAAELVGRKWVNGELVDNPNAKWAITETNRDVTQEIIRDGVALHWDVDKVADRLEETGLYSDYRAEMIARTEVSRAQNAGMLEAGRQARAAGLNIRKVWTLGDNPCEICEGIAAEYEDEDLDEVFESELGDSEAPPIHPNCDCDLELIEIESDEE